MPEDYRLQLFGFPQLKSLQHLSDYLHLSKSLLYRLSKFNDKFYFQYQIPKKNGAFRNISSPSKEMKAVQAWILRNILEKIAISDHANGFVKKRNLLDNAQPHLGNRFLLCLDIDDFFPTISYAKVWNVFRTIGYNAHISHVLTSYCTCGGKLPQGGVTSPALSNIICIRMDNRISGYVGKQNITYTRYADDMTFSAIAPARLVKAKEIVTKIIQDEGFVLNSGKTRFLGPRTRRAVTGLVIGEKTVGIGKIKKRLLRAKIHKLVSKSVDPLQEEETRRHIEGWLSHMKAVDKLGLRQLLKYREGLEAKYATP